MQPKVSVIVPVYKVDRYLTQCIKSIINQTLKDIEIIIVDEGDQDRCREIIDFFASRDSRIIAPHQKNGGYGASCNYGFEIAKGEYIAIVESDDWIEPEMYEEMYAYAKKLDADIVKTPYSEYFSNGKKRDCCYRKYMADSTPQNSCFSMKDFGEMLEIHASLWSGIYKTEYMRKKHIQFIKAKGGAYVDVGFRIDTLINSDKIAWLDKPYYNYRVDAIGSTTNNFKLSPMIQRWKEAHQKFALIQDDYDKYYGSHLVLDEFLNTLGWIPNIKTSINQIKEINENFSFIKESSINMSKALSQSQKNIILSFKNHPYRYWLKEDLKRKFNDLKIRKLLDKYLSTKIKHFSYKALVSIGISNLAINSMQNNSIWRGGVKPYSQYLFLFAVLAFIFYWASLFLLKFRGIIKGFIKNKK